MVIMPISLKHESNSACGLPYIPLSWYVRPYVDYKLKTLEIDSVLQLSLLLTLWASTTTTMVAWAMAMVAWDVAMDVAMEDMDTPLTVHAAMEDTGLLASSEKF